LTVTYHAGRRIQGTSTDVAEFYCGETPVIDGSDTVITFLQDGKFIPTSSFDIEYLVVAGGGQGGQSNAGGGGAGGYLANNSKSHGVTAQDYTITVGGKGTSSGSISQRGTAGGGATVVHEFSNNTNTTYTGTASSFSTVGVGTRDLYIKKIDANNEGVFTKIWKNGSAVEVQIA